jgi:hypothetical protein
MSTGATTFPFGMYKGKPLAAVPAGYLTWLLREAKLSSGIRAAVAAELRSRGRRPPDPPPPRVPACPRCGDAGFACAWQEDRGGGRRVRAGCVGCGGYLAFLPCRPPYTDEADAAASPAAILDVLTRAEGLGVEVLSDGASAWLRPGAPPELQATLRECSHRVGRMMGDTTRKGGRRC